MTQPKSTSKPPSPRKLTPKQELFIIEYAKDFNATQAAIRAGYAPKYADREGHRLVEKCRELIDEKKSAVMAKQNLTLEKWVQIVTKLALYDPRKLFDKFGNPTEIPELGRLASLAVSGFEIEELFDGRGEERKKIGYARKVKLLDRTPYILALGKYLNAFPTAKSKEAVPPSLPPTRWDTSSWTAEDWESFKRLRDKSKMRVIEAQAHGS